MDPASAPPRDGTARAIAERFGLGSDPELAGPAAAGEQGHVRRLSTTVEGRRRHWAVKESLTALSASDVEEPAAFQEAATAAGVPAPAVVRAPDGTVLAEVPGAAVRVFTWVDLDRPTPELDPVAVGEVLARLHRVDFDGRGGEHPWYTQPVGRSRWDALTDGVRRAGAPFAEALSRYRAELVALEDWLAPARELRTCHRDLWADNVLGAGRGLCVIDWDNCGLADPGQELAKALFEFGGGDPSRARLLHEAYRDAGGPGRVVRREDFSMAIAELGHIGERHLRMWLEARTPGPQQTHAQAGVEELLERPLTRVVIEQLLDCVR